MPKFRPTPDLEMHYEVDNFTDPWRTPEDILMIHGNAESGLAYYAWVPKMARQFRVVRPDMRGFGQSTPMPRHFPWSLDRIIDDYCSLMDHLHIDRFHLVGAKIGGTIARAFAARRADRVCTLTVVGTPPPFRAGKAEIAQDQIREFEEDGVESWARRLTEVRLGKDFPPEGVEWWIKFMGRTAVSTQVGFRPISGADISADIPNISCPTLVITTEGSALSSVQENRKWQEQIKGSELLVLPGESYHVATTHAEQCADATLDFIKRRGRHCRG